MKFAKEMKTNLVWNLCDMEHHGNLPTEKGEYLIVDPINGFDIFFFFKKGDIMDSSPMDDHTTKKYGFVRNCVATEDSFFRVNENGFFEKKTVTAWAKLPEDKISFLNSFIVKEME